MTTVLLCVLGDSGLSFPLRTWSCSDGEAESDGCRRCSSSLWLCLVGTSVWPLCMGGLQSLVSMMSKKLVQIIAGLEVRISSTQCSELLVACCMLDRVTSTVPEDRHLPV